MYFKYENLKELFLIELLGLSIYTLCDSYMDKNKWSDNKKMYISILIILVLAVIIYSKLLN